MKKFENLHLFLEKAVFKNVAPGGVLISDWPVEL